MHEDVQVEDLQVGELIQPHSHLIFEIELREVLTRDD